MTKRISVEQMPPAESEEQKRHLVRYVNFINSRPERDLHQKHFETHHIYPKSLAKKNNISDFDGDWNLIELTFREHFVAHMILFYCGYSEMVFAFNMMLHCNSIKINSRIYEKLIKNQRDILKEKLTNTVWVNNGTNSKQVKLNEIPDGWHTGMVGDRHWINNGVENKYILITEKIPENFVKGRLSIGYWIHNDNEEKYTNEDIVPQGFKIGRLLSTTKNTKWITNGSENKMISKDSDVDDGWRLGVTTDVKGYRLITDGNTTKYLYGGEVIPKGWRYGSLQKQQYVTWINNGELNKKWDMSKELPNGFTLGRIVNGFFITDGKIAKKVNNENEIPFGWRKGRLKRTKEQIKNNFNYINNII